MQEKTHRWTSFRVSEQDEAAIQKILALGPVRTRSGAIAYALWVVAQQLEEKAA